MVIEAYQYSLNSDYANKNTSAIYILHGYRQSYFLQYKTEFYNSSEIDKHIYKYISSDKLSIQIWRSHVCNRSLIFNNQSPFYGILETV